jgi:hypothetical protein
MLAILERASVSIRGQGVEGSMICPSSIRHRSLADIHEILTAPKRALLTEPFIVSACTIFIDYMGACRSLKTNYLRIRMRTHTQTEHIYENYYKRRSSYIEYRTSLSPFDIRCTIFDSWPLIPDPRPLISIPYRMIDIKFICPGCIP